MDKNFIENCKLLKRQFIQLTQADTTVQSTNNANKNNTTTKIINDAKKLLLYDDIDESINSDSVIKYAKALEKFDSNNKSNYRKTLCRKEIVKWNDEIFSMSLPHPKNNSKYLKYVPNDEIDKINKYENMCVKNEFSKEITEKDTKKINDNENTEQILYETKIIDIPELEITSQNIPKVDFLEIKKINIEDKEIPNFDIKDDTDVSRNKNTEYNKKIDNFLSNLQKFKMTNINKPKNDPIDKNKQITKPKSCSYLETKISSYEHRFKAQKDIIATQKEKLEEQNKIIEDLKLNKINKEAKASLERGKELRKSLINSSKFKLKPKPDKPELKELDNDLSLNFSKAPRIVQMMENRAKERHEKRLLIQERKRLIEEEKKRQAEELAQRKIKEETEEKQKRIEQMKKHREMVRQLELKKQKEKKHYIKINEIASDHYKKYLKKFAVQHFKMLLYNIKIKAEIAKRFYENNIVIKCFQFWWKFVKEISDYKKSLAQKISRKRLLKDAISCWKNNHFEAIQRKQVAIDRYEMSLEIKFFTAWHRIVCENYIQYTINAQKADKYYKRILLIHCLENWRSLPAIIKIERIQNERKRKWRLRVAEVLSDYDPLKNYE